jgi:hypothetical protein
MMRKKLKMKKILTEQRLCELAGIKEVGPTGTQTWNPRAEREAKEKEAEEDFFARPGRAEIAAQQREEEAEELSGDETVEVAAVAIPPELEIPWEELRNSGEAPAVVVDWIRSEERTPYGTQTVGVDGDAPTGVDAAGEIASGYGQPAAYKHINPHNQISHTYAGTKIGGRGVRILPGSPWDPFPKEWTGAQKALGKALVGAIVDPEREQQIQNLVRKAASRQRGGNAPPVDPAPRGKLAPALKKKGLPDQGPALRRALEFEPSRGSGLEE